MKFYFLVLLLIVAVGDAAPLKNIVIDIDDTMMFTDARRWPPEKIQQAKDQGIAVELAPGKVYRSSLLLKEGLLALAARKLNTFAFSSHSDAKRSERLADFLHRASQVSFEKVLTSNHVIDANLATTRINEALQPEWSIFNGKSKKDLRLVGRGTLGDTILIDNDPRGVIRGQEKNFLWFTNTVPELEWARVVGLIDLASEVSVNLGISVPDALWTLQWKLRPDDTLEYLPETAEGELVYKRGYEILRSISPDLPPFTLDVSIPHSAGVYRKRNPESAVAAATPTPRSYFSTLVDRIWQAIGWSEPQPLDPEHPPRRELEIGDLVTLKEGEFTVIEILSSETSEDKEFMIKNKSDGEVRRLIVALPNSANFARQRQFLFRMLKLGVPHTKIVELDDTYMSTDWQRPEKVVFGEHVTQLKSLLYRLSAEGIYLSDLEADHLLWFKGRWVLAYKTGRVRQDLAPDKIAARYIDRISKRWDLELTSLHPAKLRCAEAVK